MEFMVSSEQILGFCVLITSVWAVFKIIREINKPNDDLKKTVEQHSVALDNDNKRLKQLDDDNRMILQSLLVIVNHSIDNNGIDKLKEARTELQEYLIKR
jgi:hypothetical protein